MIKTALSTSVNVGQYVKCHSVPKPLSWGQGLEVWRWFPDSECNVRIILCMYMYCYLYLHDWHSRGEPNKLGNLFSYNLTSDSELEPSKKAKNGLIVNFPRAFQIFGSYIESVHRESYLFTQCLRLQSLHRTLRNRSMPFLLANYSHGSISCQPLVVRINNATGGGCATVDQASQWKVDILKSITNLWKSCICFTFILRYITKILAANHLFFSIFT